MKGMWLRIGGVLAVATTVFLLLTNIEEDLEPFGNVIYPIDGSLVSAEMDMAETLSYALWEKRSLDCVLLGLLLFLSSTCCAAMLIPLSSMER